MHVCISRYTYRCYNLTSCPTANVSIARSHYVSTLYTVIIPHSRTTQSNTCLFSPHTSNPYNPIDHAPGPAWLSSAMGPALGFCGLRT